MTKMNLMLSVSAFLGFAACTESTKQAGVDFETQIYPLIQKSCLECHRPPWRDRIGRLKLAEGGLVVTDKNALMRGGESGPSIIPGAPEESDFLALTLLPPDDVDHMPPSKSKETPPWTDAEKELVRQWIADGADFGDWTEDPEFAGQMK